MSQVFILQNQHEHFYSKGGEWVDGRESQTLYRATHRDEALNQMVEVNSKDYLQRIQILTCELDERKRIIIPAEWLPPLDDSTKHEVPSGTEEDIDQSPQVTVTTAEPEGIDESAPNLAPKDGSNIASSDLFQG